MATPWIDMLDGAKVEYFYPRIQAIIERSSELWAPLFSVQDVLKKIEEGDYQVWVAGRDGDAEIEMWGLTQCLTYPRGRVMMIIWCGGNNAEHYFERFTDAVEYVGREMGCLGVEVRGRPGWAKALKQFGYRPTEYILYKDIRHGEGRGGERNADEQGGVDAGTASDDPNGDGSGGQVPERGDSTTT